MYPHSSYLPGLAIYLEHPRGCCSLRQLSSLPLHPQTVLPMHFSYAESCKKSPSVTTTLLGPQQTLCFPAPRVTGVTTRLDCNEDQVLSIFATQRHIYKVFKSKRFTSPLHYAGSHFKSSGYFFPPSRKTWDFLNSEVQVGQGHCDAFRSRWVKRQSFLL